MIQRQSLWNTIAPILVIIGVFSLVGLAARSPAPYRSTNVDSRVAAGSEAAGSDATGSSSTGLSSTVQKIDRLFTDRWHEAGLQSAVPADDLTLLRRLSLVLHGTSPSLEEIRQFEFDNPTGRIERWTDRFLADRRYGDYFARRLSRVFAGSEEGQFLLFRRDRFWAWLGDQLHANRPYDELVRDMIAERGLWTGEPEVNFVTSVISDNVIDHNKLAGRTVRAFLGQRIDCAQCHNHPFASWKQSQFEGLAACYGQVSISPVGVEDNQRAPYQVLDRTTSEQREVSPAVPFHSEWMPSEGTQRQQLAIWITHSDNFRFDRAIVNRVWGLMFGKPWMQPVDDLPNPTEPDRDQADLLDVLGADFRAHGCDLKHLISTIAATRVFRCSSQHSAFESGERTETVEQTWAAFPLTRLRPEQVIGSMLQASSIKTVDQHSHWSIRAVRFFRELEFVKEYGDLGDDELNERTGTIPQALLRMNSDFAAEWTKSTIFSAAGRIASMAPDDVACLDLCFLVCLSRHPFPEELSLMLPQLERTTGDDRSHVVEDIFWALFNSPEFCWEH